MTKGWRNDPAWVRLHEEKMQKQGDKLIARMETKAKLDAAILEEAMARESLRRHRLFSEIDG